MNFAIGLKTTASKNRRLSDVTAQENFISENEMQNIYINIEWCKCKCFMETVHFTLWRFDNQACVMHEDNAFFKSCVQCKIVSRFAHMAA